MNSIIFTQYPFEGIAKTNTTNTDMPPTPTTIWFEGIAKTNTTNTLIISGMPSLRLRVLLKQIQQTLESCHNSIDIV